jgi:hypothetical protein
VKKSIIFIFFILVSISFISASTYYSYAQETDTIYSDIIDIYNNIINSNDNAYTIHKILSNSPYFWHVSTVKDHYKVSLLDSALVNGLDWIVLNQKNLNNGRIELVYMNDVKKISVIITVFDDFYTKEIK